MSSTRVVVTGLGALTPIGNNVKAYWDGLVSGQSGAALITSFDTTKHKTKFACTLKGYDPHNHLDAKDARRMDPFAQYAMVAGDEAIQDAGLITPLVDKERVGVVWGSGIGGLGTTEATVLGFAASGMDPKINPFLFLKLYRIFPLVIYLLNMVLRGLTLLQLQHVLLQ